MHHHHFVHCLLGAAAGATVGIAGQMRRKAAR